MHHAGAKGLMYNYNKHAKFLIFFFNFLRSRYFCIRNQTSEHTHALILILTCQQFVRKKYRRMSSTFHEVFYMYDIHLDSFM